MRAGVSALRLGAVTATLAVLAVAAFLIARMATPPPPAAMILPHPVREGRFWYPPGRHPALALPDGESREIRSLLNVTRPLRFGEYVWNDAGVPAAPAWIRIDLAHQTMSVFRGGHEIGSAVILFGTDGKPTPTGIFPIRERATRHRSTLYDAEMPYMLRLTDDGVAIHASKVHYGAATHGCIGIPIDFARRLFGQMRKGDIVAIMPGTQITPAKTGPRHTIVDG